MADWIHTHFVPFLINATWQSSVLIAVVFALTRLLRNRPAIIRQTLWMIALFGSLLVPLVSVGLNGIGSRSIALLKIAQSPALSPPMDTTMQIDSESQSPLNPRTDESANGHRSGSESDSTRMKRVTRIQDDTSSTLQTTPRNPENPRFRLSESANQQTDSSSYISRLTHRFSRFTFHVSRNTQYAIRSTQHALSPNFLLAVWAIGACLMSLRLISRGFLLARVRKAAVIETHPSVREMLDALIDPMKIHQPVEVRISPAISIPCVFGVRKPVLLLPANLSESLEPPELRAVLAHELAHVRRKDYLIHCCQSVIQAIYWFHPLIHFAARESARECERVCDDWVLRVCGGEQMAYVKGLAKLAEASTPSIRIQPALPLFRRKSDLFKRIESILSVTGLRRATLSWKGRCALGLLGIGLICAAGTTRVLGSNAKTEKVAEQQASVSDANTMKVSGVVVDSDGKPVPNATVYVHTTNQRILAQTTTQSDGKFVFADLPPLEKQHHDTFIVRAEGHGLGWVDRSGEEGFSDLQVRLGKPGAIRGRVVDERNQPIPNAVVYPWSIRLNGDWMQQERTVWLGEQYSFTQTTTDGQGNFVLKELPQGAFVQLKATHDGFAEIVKYDIFPVGIDSVILSLPPAAMMYGRVLYPDSNEPVAGVRVHNQYYQEGVVALLKGISILEASAVTDENGRYQFKRLVPGSYKVSVSPPDGWVSPTIEHNARVEAEGSEPADIVLSQGGWITGKVTDAGTGEPIAGARISASSALFADTFTTESKEDGTYRLLAIESYREDKQPALLFSIGSKETSIDLNNPESLGDLPKLFQEHGIPLQNFTVIQKNDDASLQIIDQNNRKAYAIREDQGKFNFYQTSPRRQRVGGKLSVRIDAPEAYIQPFPQPFLKDDNPANDFIEVAKGQTVTGVDFQLKRGEQIRGKVVDVDGNPLSGAWMSVVGNNQVMTGNRHGKSDANGIFVIKGLDPTQPVQLRAVYRGLGIISDNLWLKADQTETIILKLLPLASVTGRVVDENQKPIPGHQIGLGEFISGGFSTFPVTSTHPQGRFEIGGLVPGALYAIYVDKRYPFPDPSIRITAISGKVHDVGDLVFHPDALELLVNQLNQADEETVEILTLTDENFEVEVLKSSLPVLVEVWSEIDTGPNGPLSIVWEVAKKHQELIKVGRLNREQNPKMTQKYQLQLSSWIDLRFNQQLLLFKGGTLIQKFENTPETIEEILSASRKMGKAESRGDNTALEEIVKIQGMAPEIQTAPQPRPIQTPQATSAIRPMPANPTLQPQNFR